MAQGGRIDRVLRTEFSKDLRRYALGTLRETWLLFVEETLADASGLFVATGRWKNAILASMQRAWIHRMSVVLIREREDWRILLVHLTAVQPL